MQTAKVVASDRTVIPPADPSGSFGRAVAISGNYAFVGSGERYGAVHIYKYINASWIRLRKITPPEGSGFGTPIAAGNGYLLIANGTTAFIYKQSLSNPDEWLLLKKLIDAIPGGSTVGAIDGDNIVLGARNDPNDASGGSPVTDAGSAFIFNKNQGGTDNWGLVRKLVAPERSAVNFGYTVSISADQIAVGSSAYAMIFRRDKGGSNNWGFVQQISAPGIQSVKYPVSIDGNYLVIGLPLDDVANVRDAGSILVYKKTASDNWTQMQKVVPATPELASNFGDKVVIEGDVIAVGAFGYHQNAGAVYAVGKISNSEQWDEPKTLLKLTGSQIFLGSAIDINNNLIIAGASGNYPDMASTGSAFIFSRNLGGTNNWGKQQTLRGIDRRPDQVDDQFGSSVAISGDYAIVGAPQNDGNGTDLTYIPGAGAAYIAQRTGNNWTSVKKLTGLPRNVDDKFGFAVAMNDTIAAVGVPYEGSSNNTGAVYVYTRNQGGANNWGLVTKLFIPEPAAPGANLNYQFGYSISISPQYIAVGATGDHYKTGQSGQVASTGSVYVFRLNAGSPASWTAVKKLNGLLPASADHFGTSVSISGDYLFVGSPDEDRTQTGGSYVSNSGAAYIYRRNEGGADNWGLVKRIQNDLRTTDDRFGLVVSAYGDYGLVTSVAGKGSATIFKRTQSGEGAWGMLKKLTSPEGTSRNLFGYAASISENHAIVGAYATSGQAYVFQKNKGGADFWGLDTILQPAVPAAEDRFGFAVAVSNNNFIVGAPQEDEDNLDQNTITNAGSAYIFQAPQPAPASITKIDAGSGADYNATDGVFLADRNFTGGTASSTTGDILNTTDDGLYLTYRFGTTRYAVPVANGNYSIVLHFVEHYFGVAGRGGVNRGPGRRRFNVDVEGARVLTNYDIFVAAGGAMTLKKEVFQATVSDGTINIDFLPGSVDNPIISAIEIVPVGGSVILGPVADAYTRGGDYQDTNFGLQPALEVKSGSLGKSLDRLAFLKFDLARVPSVGRATLRLYGRNVQSNSFTNVSVGAVSIDSWTETGITWRNRPPYDSVLGSIDADSTSRYYEVDVTAFVRSQLAGDGIASFELISTPDRLQASFNSREAANNQPQLVIETLAPGANLREGQVVPEKIAATASYIFPNPVSRAFTVMVSDAHAGPVSLQLTDLSGRAVISEKKVQSTAREIRVDISGLRATKGIFLLKIQSEHHSEVLKVLLMP